MPLSGEAFGQLTGGIGGGDKPKGFVGPAYGPDFPGSNQRFEAGNRRQRPRSLIVRGGVYAAGGAFFTAGSLRPE